MTSSSFVDEGTLPPSEDDWIAGSSVLNTADLLTQETDTGDVLLVNKSKNVVLKKSSGGDQSFASKMKQTSWLVILNAILDSFTVSYNFIKFLFDLIFANSQKSSADALHEWMLTSVGIALAATEAVTFAIFSVFGNYFDDKDKTSWKYFFVWAWPYIRDVVKVAKNTKSGISTSIKVANQLFETDVNFLVLPLSLILGSLGAVQRIWMRRMRSWRKDMMKANDKILEEIEQLQVINDRVVAEFRERMKRHRQAESEKHLALLAAAYGGAIDSLYLFVGIFSIAMPAWPALVVTTAFCGIYSLACVLGRMYEEYAYQRDLEITEAKNELALLRREQGEAMHLSFLQLQEISMQLAQGNRDPELIGQQQGIAAKLMEYIETFNDKHSQLQNMLSLSNTSAFLAGLRDGLSAYGALVSSMFCLSTILFLTGVTFPAALLVASISSGLVLLAGFITNSMVTHYLHRKQLEADHSQSTERLSRILGVLENVKQGVPEVQPLPEEDSWQFLSDEVCSSPQFRFQEWFEVIRSLFSGPPKGLKFIEQVLNSLQEPDENGHYKDTPVMMVFAAVFAVLYALSLAISAYIKQFNKVIARPEKQDQATEKTSSSPHAFFSRRRVINTDDEVQDLEARFATPAAA